MKKKIKIVVGGQWGSESKGEFVGRLCKEINADYCVRTGSINAGHTVYYEGKPYKMQQIPVGWVNPNTKLVIGAGAYINPEILKREMEMINNAMGGNVNDRLYIDGRCGMHLPRHHDKEKGLHERMGSTGEGCMEASVEKMKREFTYKSFREWTLDNEPFIYNLCDASFMLNEAYDAGEQIIIEGTQGTSLDLHYGDYPYVTSRQTIAAQWITEAGLSPSLDYDVILVMRTYPIRVAGNSGPMENEIEWHSLVESINVKLSAHNKPPLVDPGALDAYKVALDAVMVKMGIGPQSYASLEKQKIYSKEYSELHKRVFESLPENVTSELFRLFETTTVTKKLRRISEFDYRQARYAVMLNRPSEIVMGFLNYKWPTLSDKKTWEEIKNDQSFDEVKDWLDHTQKILDVPITYVSTNKNQLIKIHE